MKFTFVRNSSHPLPKIFSSKLFPNHFLQRSAIKGFEDLQLQWRLFFDTFFWKSLFFGLTIHKHFQLVSFLVLINIKGFFWEVKFFLTYAKLQLFLPSSKICSLQVYYLYFASIFHIFQSSCLERTSNIFTSIPERFWITRQVSDVDCSFN